MVCKVNRKQAETLLKVLKQWFSKTDEFLKEMEKIGVKVKIRVMIDVTPENDKEGFCCGGT